LKSFRFILEKNEDPVDPAFSFVLSAVCLSITTGDEGVELRIGTEEDEGAEDVDRDDAADVLEEIDHVLSRAGPSESSVSIGAGSDGASGKLVGSVVAVGSSFGRTAAIASLSGTADSAVTDEAVESTLDFFPTLPNHVRRLKVSFVGVGDGVKFSVLSPPGIVKTWPSPSLVPKASITAFAASGVNFSLFTRGSGRAELPHIPALRRVSLLSEFSFSGLDENPEGSGSVEKNGMSSMLGRTNDSRICIVPNVRGYVSGGSYTDGFFQPSFHPSQNDTPLQSTIGDNRFHSKG
jgi:hypothetical protein